MHRSRAWSQRDIQAIVESPSVRAISYTIIGAISAFGVVNVTIRELTCHYSVVRSMLSFLPYIKSIPLDTRLHNFLVVYLGFFMLDFVCPMMCTLKWLNEFINAKRRTVLHFLSSGRQQYNLLLNLIIHIHGQERFMALLQWGSLFKCSSIFIKCLNTDGVTNGLKEQKKKIMIQVAPKRQHNYNK